MILFVTGVPSCSDRLIAAQSVLRQPDSGVPLDIKAIKALATKHVVTGDRIALQLPDSSANSVNSLNVSVGDTTVASIDATGLLHALSIGKTWVSWKTQTARDSSKVSVDFEGGMTSLEQDYTQPTAPEKTVDVRYPTGRTRGAAQGKSMRVGPGGDLQAALDAAQPGDEIVLANGATFVGNFVLPNKSNADGGWIVVKAETLPSAAGTRTSPELAANTAKVFTPNQDAAIKTAPGAHEWRLVGFEVGIAAGVTFNYGIVVLSRGDENTLAEQSSNIVLDRMYIHGLTTETTRRCVAFNGRYQAVIDSWLGECHAKGFDAQGVGGWNGGGPFLIENNRIEASGQAVMFGGQDPRITNLSPSDIIIRHNYLYKPLSWGNKWTVKATFELKHGRRVLFEGNVLENHWIDAQAGYAILFQTLADDNYSWNWTTVQDVMVRNNIIKNSTSGATVVGRVAYGGGTYPTNPTSRVVFLNNLWQDVGKDPFTGAGGRIFQLLGDSHDITIVNNTITLNGQAASAMMFDGSPGIHTQVVNNVFPATEYGIAGSSVGQGTNAMAAYAPDGMLAGNVLPGQPFWIYPTNNFFPATFGSILFRASGSGDFSLTSANAFYSGVLGLIGVNMTTLNSMVSGVAY